LNDGDDGGCDVDLDDDGNVVDDDDGNVVDDDDDENNRR
jgi:hypothetical protein